jgi:hypothetical protein
MDVSFNFGSDTIHVTLGSHSVTGIELSLGKSPNSRLLVSKIQKRTVSTLKGLPLWKTMEVSQK